MCRDRARVRTAKEMTPTRTRDEHLAWAKARALEYLDKERDLKSAFASMCSDLGKHPELRVSAILAQLGLMYTLNSDERGLRGWINGFN